jgi:hypothetical protein
MEIQVVKGVDVAFPKLSRYQAALYPASIEARKPAGLIIVELASPSP